MHIVSVRENPEYAATAIGYFQKRWSENNPKIYEDSITHCVDAPTPLPQWYLLYEGNEIIGCAGLITNDFISRMDLYPWFCALYIEPEFRGHRYGGLLVQKAKDDAKKAGFDKIYLYTHLEGYYEKFGFAYIGLGYHPWGEESRMFAAEV